LTITTDDIYVYRLGAAPRPSGGFVMVASAYYTDAITLIVVDEAFEQRRFDLPPMALGASLRLAVIVAPATAGAAERAHVLLSPSATRIVHFDVDLETGAFEREDIGI
jgi:hypothetical protein